MLAAGDRVGDYEIEAELGAGGMATVYRARHVVLDTVHALKVLDPAYRANPQARQRFLDEARIQAKHLDHPGIVKVTNLVATADHAALVMELVPGGSLESRIAGLRVCETNPFRTGEADVPRRRADDQREWETNVSQSLKQRPDEIKRLMRAILDAVGHAHAAGVVHRDLKPANVLLAGPTEQPIPKVTDFGIAKVTAAVAGLGKKSTAGDSRMGTLGYMSPEQIRRAKDVTARSDLFSLGVMLYELSTGEVPFAGDSDYDVMENIVNGRYQPPERCYREIDPVLAAVIKRALEPDPARRFASCAEMAAALRGDDVQPAPVPVARAPGAGPRMVTGPGSARTPAKGVGRWGRGLAVAGLVVAGLALGAGGMYLATRDRGGAGRRAVDAGHELVVAATVDAGPPSAPIDAGTARIVVPLFPDVDAGPARVVIPLFPDVDAGAGHSRLDALLGPGPSPPPLPNPCRKTWFAGDAMTIAITAKTTGTCGELYFYDRVAGYPVRTCHGNLTGCRVAGQAVTARYDCLFSRPPIEGRQGMITMTCGGGRMTAKTSDGTFNLR